MFNIMSIIKHIFEYVKNVSYSFRERKKVMLSSYVGGAGQYTKAVKCLSPGDRLPKFESGFCHFLIL